MPETFLHIRWPDGVRETCYSPSSVITRHLQPRSYTVAAFVAACRAGLPAASDRVREIYGGLGCSRALAQLATIEAAAGRYDEIATMHVEHIGDELRRSA